MVMLRNLCKKVYFSNFLPPRFFYTFQLVEMVDAAKSKFVFTFLRTRDLTIKAGFTSRKMKGLKMKV